MAKEGKKVKAAVAKKQSVCLVYSPMGVGRRRWREAMGGVRCTGYGWLTSVTVSDGANKRQKAGDGGAAARRERETRPKRLTTRRHRLGKLPNRDVGAKIVRGGGVWWSWWCGLGGGDDVL